MTGAEIHAQVMEALTHVHRVDDHGNVYAGHDDDALAALAPCVVLTAEEAAVAYEAADTLFHVAAGHKHWPPAELGRRAKAARALLTPERGDEARHPTLMDGLGDE